MREASDCRHELQAVGSLSIAACGVCASVDWWGPEGLLLGSDGLAQLFGAFELDHALPGIGTPAQLVLAYRPPTNEARAFLDAFPAHTWLRVDDDLWMSHDSERLLLTPTDHTVAMRFAG